MLWIVWTAIGGTAIYWYVTKDHSYWKKHGVPSASALPLLGSVKECFSKPVHEIEVERYKKFGRIYGHYEGSRPVLNVAEPELVRYILVKDFHVFTNRRSFLTGDPMGDKMLSIMESEDWKRLRTIISPVFTTGKIKRMLSIVLDCAKTLSDNFAGASKEGNAIDVKGFYGAFSMDVIASAAFSTKLNSHNDPGNKFVVTARMMFDQAFNWRFFLIFLFPCVMKFFRLSIMPPDATGFFKELTLQIIRERKRTGQTRNDFLQLLMDTAKEEIAAEDAQEIDQEPIDSNYGDNTDSYHLKTNFQKKTLSEDEVVSQCVLFFLAGYETTSAVLTYASYSLALNPACQEVLIRDIDDAMKEAGGEITYEAIQRMKYLNNVVSETLRMFPPAVRLERRTSEEYKLGDTGITLPKEALVCIPIYAKQRDEQLFPDPHKFDPDRFSAEGKSGRDPYTFLPFGFGPRACIGMRFALMEVKVCLAYVLSRFRIKRSPDTKVPLDFYLGVAFMVAKEVSLTMERRTDGALNR